MDIFPENIKKFKAKYPNVELIEISAIFHKNLDLVKAKLWNLIEKNQYEILENQEDEVKTIEFEPDYVIERPYHGHFVVSGKKVEELYYKIPINTYDNLLRFNNILKKIGVWDALIKYEIKRGDTVEIYGFEFEWEDDE
ncbi:Obg family GTPase CgtA [Mycoplasmopsis cynos]|nr:Obg family GTPase CgtA [Mycoplasmopsis cynos]